MALLSGKIGLSLQKGMEYSKKESILNRLTGS
jgi:hypothetical protein